MCGICGIALTNPAQPVDSGRLRSMRDLLSHRGPDDAGIWTQPGVGLAHRRLSIIDLSAAGKQPLSNENGSIWVTFNGEIYNYQELRAELVRAGHEFRTHTDTEVLVHGYEEWGEGLPGRLNGIFAFGLYDCEKRQLLLARDHLGVKPLFWGVRAGELAFASETRSVVQALGLEPRPSRAALQEYLTFRYLAWDRTFFEGVNRMPPGHLGWWRNGRLEIRRYWAPQQVGLREGGALGESVEALDGYLGRAVRRQLMSDVPLGAFCSGGVDSGLTTHYAVGTNEASRFHTYSVGMAERQYDETPLALLTATALGTIHQTQTTDAAAVHRGLLALQSYGDEPLSHPNMVPLHELSRLARDGVTVVLTGEGADELFCGYPRYHVYAARQRADFLPGPLRAALGAGLGMMPGHRLAKLGRAFQWSAADAALFNSAFVDPTVVQRITGGSVDEAYGPRQRLIAETLLPHDPVASISRYELTTYLVSALERLDRVSMAVGLEARVPFLDVELVEWGLGLPSAHKLATGKNKVVVKKLAEGKLDPQIVGGRKSGFGLPLDEWFRGPVFADSVQRILRPDHPANEYLDRTAVHGLVGDHLAGRGNHGELLWLLANLYNWFDVHAAGPSTHTAAEDVLAAQAAV